MLDDVTAHDDIGVELTARVVIEAPFEADPAVDRRVRSGIARVEADALNSRTPPSKRAEEAAVSASNLHNRRVADATGQDDVVGTGFHVLLESRRAGLRVVVGRAVLKECWIEGAIENEPASRTGVQCQRAGAKCPRRLRRVDDQVLVHAHLLAGQERRIGRTIANRTVHFQSAWLPLLVRGFRLQPEEPDALTSA